MYIYIYIKQNNRDNIYPYVYVYIKRKNVIDTYKNITKK